MSRFPRRFLAALAPLAAVSFALVLVPAFRPATPQAAAQPGDSAAAPAAAPAEKPADAGERVVYDMSARSPAEVRIHAALQNPKGVDIEFIDQPLKEAMEFIEDAHGITIVIDERALQDEGIAMDEPLNYILSGVTLKSALNIMLRPLGLTYVFEDEVLKITTKVAADERLTTRVYDVSSLARHGIEPARLAEILPQIVAPERWPTAPTDPQLTFSPDGKAVTVKTADAIRLYAVPAGTLLRTLESQEPRPAAGALGQTLVVSQTQSVHEKIVDLLDQLARAGRQAGIRSTPATGNSPFGFRPSGTDPTNLGLTPEKQKPTAQRP
ncbi:MAG: hypothetical protein KY476_20160 [Planctomycetes bacterium]|nr:hypothetical protein [Planctomycetota bacterium]